MREQQDIALALMIALGMVMFDIFPEGTPQGALTKGCSPALPPIAKSWWGGGVGLTLTLKIVQIVQIAVNRGPLSVPGQPPILSS
jgi:hypothetical protein